METEDLIKEIIENARRDRARLEDVSSALLSSITVAGVEDPLAKAAMAEQLARVTDSLSKTNQQLVELVKIHAKQDPAGKAKAMAESDKESLFDEIQEAPQEE